MSEEGDTLVMRRSRRSTAGNRMEAALAEFKAEELGQDIEEDKDFIMEVDEQDAFESDFESTDEEGAQEDVDAAAERMVRDEEKEKKKAARSQLDKITAAAHARQKATFNPELISAPAVKTQTGKMGRRVSLGAALDAETGSVVESGKRKSTRRHTMMSTSLTQIRAKDELEKKSTGPKRNRVKIQALTQDQLIARALDMEDGNIKEHRNYLQVEEEKRKRARVVRTAVEGPLIRWISRAEQTTVLVPPPAPSPLVPTLPPYTGTVQPTAPYSAPIPQPSQSSLAPQSYPTQHISTSAASTSSYALAPPNHSYSVPASAPAQPMLHYAAPSQQSASQMTFVNHPYPPQPAYQPPTTASPLIERVETVTKNYVVHETSQKEGASKPLWKDTMTAMFGDHVQWDAVKMYAGKGRPLSRPKDVCPITGQIAKYRDPRTGVPFADVQAFTTLTKIISHEFVWSESLGCYVSTRSDNPVDGGPEGSLHSNKETMT